MINLLTYDLPGMCREPRPHPLSWGCASLSLPPLQMLPPVFQLISISSATF